MKKINILLAASTLFLAASCHSPEYVESTAERQNLTSLEAFFTFGPYIDQSMCKLNITDENADRFVIPVPWFFPETSDNETTPYMTKVRVQAAIQPNCKIEPSLTLLDLTKENIFKFTNARGESRNICITGERVKSKACDILVFSLDEPAISGIVDKTKKTVTLVSAEDLSACTATVQVSAHATISPDPSTPQDYNNGVKFTVTAHDGKTTSEYTVIKTVPEKIDKGFDKSSLETLFNFEPVSMVGLPAYNAADIYPSMAVTGGKLVFCTGSGVPVYLNGITGVKEGQINDGGISPSAITNDEAENLILCNHVDGGGEFKIWKATSVKSAPELFHSFTNSTDLPMGYSIKVIGNIDADAVIDITNEGIAGVTSSSKVTRVTVSGGAVTDVTVLDISASGLAWGNAPVNNTDAVAVAPSKDASMFLSYYDPNVLNHVAADGTLKAALPFNNGSSWALDVNNLDSKQFNHATYMSLFVVSHFPHWGCGPALYLYDISDPSALSGNLNETTSIVLSNPAIEWFQKADAGMAAGDVILAPTKDGFKLYLYYYDQNSGVLGGYSVDCIKR